MIGLKAKLIGGLIAAAAVGLLVWWVHGIFEKAQGYEAAMESAATARREAKELNDAWQLNFEKAWKQLEASEAARMALQAELGAIRAITEQLRTASWKIPVVTEKPNENGIPVPVRTRAYRLCVNAAWSRDRAAVAACEASGSDDPGGPAVPPTRVVRSGQP